MFWLGTHEPHRGFEAGAGRNLARIPPRSSCRRCSRSPGGAGDLLDYYVEIEHFDQMIVRAMATLEKAGQLDNTIVVITSDHGMPFPRAKASLYDAGAHVPLAIRWPNGIVKAGRVFEDLST